MKNRNKMKFYLIIFPVFALLTSCDDFLDEKPNAKLSTPSTLDDLQALLDNTTTTNEAGPGEGEVSADDYFLSDDDFNSITTESTQNMYRWDGKIILTDISNNGWRTGYGTVYTANTVIEELDKLASKNANQIKWDDIAGQAYFHRANAFYDMAQIWCLAYDQNSSSIDMGLPLRIITDFNIKVPRSTVEETYEFIISDLKQALLLLPTIPTSKFHPSKAAGYGLLARIYLSMRDYQHAYVYADSCLGHNNDLWDYNDVNLSGNSPFNLNLYNPEVIFFRQFSLLDVSSLIARMSNELYQSYDQNDLRKTAYFRPRSDGDWRYKGSYFGGAITFSGIATDEQYLIRAECLARQGESARALADLNSLLVNRWHKDDGVSTYIPYESSEMGQADVLRLILTERRKELMMRNIRWGDIKRLNKEGASISLTRIINGQTYSLPANDLRFALPVPMDVINTSEIKQNLR